MAAKIQMLMPVSKHNGRLGNALKERHICLIHSCVANVLQAQPATLASLVGALNLRSLNSNPAARAAVRALGEEECTSSSTPPQLEHARPAWTQSLAQRSQQQRPPQSGTHCCSSHCQVQSLLNPGVVPMLLGLLHIYPHTVLVLLLS